MVLVIIFHLAIVCLPLWCFHNFIFENMVEMFELVRKALCGSITRSTVFTMLKQSSLLDQCLLTIQNNSLLKAPVSFPLSSCFLNIKSSNRKSLKNKLDKSNMPT